MVLSMLYWMCGVRLRQDKSGFTADGQLGLCWDFVGCGRGFVHAVAIITIISRSISLLGCLGFEGFEMGAAP